MLFLLQCHFIFNVSFLISCLFAQWFIFKSKTKQKLSHTYTSKNTKTHSKTRRRSSFAPVDNHERLLVPRYYEPATKNKSNNEMHAQINKEKAYSKHGILPKPLRPIHTHTHTPVHASQILQLREKSSRPPQKSQAKLLCACFLSLCASVSLLTSIGLDWQDKHAPMSHEMCIPAGLYLVSEHMFL